MIRIPEGKVVGYNEMGHPCKVAHLYITRPEPFPKLAEPRAVLLKSSLPAAAAAATVALRFPGLRLIHREGTASEVLPI